MKTITVITLLAAALLIVQATPAASVIPNSHDDNALPTTSTNVQAYDKNRTLSRMTDLPGVCWGGEMKKRSGGTQASRQMGWKLGG
ncbi:hypothetical protein KI688_001870 [Linnemannia hyalina]|uniref:Uncharacterized protein n=1 Tax=Linnemannia hyalina TaxID=64524 RepID=A0A9P7XTS3_9FUNG|nr:hypothetical protein KI688_001870 [Linnemannia hyalina]